MSGQTPVPGSGFAGGGGEVNAGQFGHSGLQTRTLSDLERGKEGEFLGHEIYFSSFFFKLSIKIDYS